MKFAQDHINSPYLIEAFEAGSIRVGGRNYAHNLLLMPGQSKTRWTLHSIAQLDAKEVGRLASLEPDIILIGSGEKQVFPHPKTFAPLMQAGIGYEIMPTHSACRTFNILLAEDRRVLAALIV